MTVVTGTPGAAYICPVHGRFIPTELPRYEHDQPEAKCMAWVSATRFCGEFAPLAPPDIVTLNKIGITEYTGEES